MPCDLLLGGPTSFPLGHDFPANELRLAHMLEGAEIRGDDASTNYGVLLSEGCDLELYTGDLFDNEPAGVMNSPT